MFPLVLTILIIIYQSRFSLIDFHFIYCYDLSVQSSDDDVRRNKTLIILRR